VTERLLIVLALAAIVLAVALLLRARARRAASALVGQPVPEPLRARLGASPAIVYFYGPHCGSCIQQARELDALEPACRIVRLDATREPALADALRVATVPATAVVDRAGRLRALNLGYRPGRDLGEQLALAIG
jgi:hypothetical protein